MKPDPESPITFLLYFRIKCIQTFRQKDCYRTELWRALYKKAPRGQTDICPDCGGKLEKAKEEKNKKGKY